MPVDFRGHHTYLCRLAPLWAGLSSPERPAERPLNGQDEWLTPQGPPAPFMAAGCRDLVLRGSRGEKVPPIAHQRQQRRHRDERVVFPRHVGRRNPSSLGGTAIRWT